MRSFGALLLAIAASGAHAGVETVATPTPLSLTIPVQHPYLALTPAEIALGKQRAAQQLWGRRALDELVSEAKGYAARPLGELPKKGDTAHWNVAQHMLSVGLGYAFTGDRRLAEWTRDALLAYADAYPGWPLTNLRCKAFTQSPLYEAMWLCDLVRAYDCIADSGVLTDAQRQHIETDLLRAAVVCFKIDDYQKDPRIKDLHYRCYNFQAWHLAAVGLVGLAVRDASLVDWVVNSPYGLKHLIAHDIRDDGMFWERSPGYHRFVLTALVPFLEAARRCGADLWSLQVANRRYDEDGHYTTDTTDAPKSLAMMVAAPFYLAFPDLSYMALGDSDRGPLRANWLDLAAWNRTHDPKLAWQLQKDVPLTDQTVTTGRVGFLHYYRHSFRYQDVRLDGQPIRWERADGSYRLRDGTIEIDDGGVSQPDLWLLNDHDSTDLTLTWTMIRLADRGAQERSWLVFCVEAGDPSNRKSFGLNSFCREVGRAYSFKLEVRGEKATLYCDGKLVSDKPILYTHTPTWPWLIYDHPTDAPATMPLTEGTFGNSGQYRNDCSLLPATGLAVLRQGWARESTCAALSYGAYGGGHGHPDKLDLAVFAHGRQWIPTFGSMPYETHWKTEWTAQTISHNTVVIDGISQQPTGDRQVMWPTDSSAARVCGELGLFQPERKRVSAFCDSAYPGLRLQRTVQMVDDLVLDDFTIAAAPAAAAHQADWVLHLDGALSEAQPALSPRTGPLGTKAGYQLVQQEQAGPLTGLMTLTFTGQGRQLRVWLVPSDDSPGEVIVGQGLTNSPTGHMTMLVVRRTAAAHRFICVMEPVSAGDPVRSVRLERPAGAAPTVVIERRQGSRQVPLG